MTLSNHTTIACVQTCTHARSRVSSTWSRSVPRSRESRARRTCRLPCSGAAARARRSSRARRSTTCARAGHTAVCVVLSMQTHARPCVWVRGSDTRVPVGFWRKLMQRSWIRCARWPSSEATRAWAARCVSRAFSCSSASLFLRAGSSGCLSLECACECLFWIRRKTFASDKHTRVKARRRGVGVVRRCTCVLVLSMHVRLCVRPSTWRRQRTPAPAPS